MDPQEHQQHEGGGGRHGARLWARSELSTRWRSLLVLGLLFGLVGGVALAAVAGARRTSTVYERFRVETKSQDAIVFATQVGIFDADYTPVRDLPEVVDSGEFALASVFIEEHPELGTLAPADDRLYRTISRPLVREGRLPDVDRDDEIVVNEFAADELGLGIGDTVTLRASTTPIYLLEGGAPPPDDGPRIKATVVGIVGKSQMELVFASDDPAFVPSAALLLKRPEIEAASNLLVRLRPGTDVNEFRERAATALGLPDVPVRNASEDTKRITHATDLEQTGLLLFAFVAVLAGLVLVGQALSRVVYSIAESAPTLRALGLTRGQLALGLAGPFVLSALVGIGVAIAVAIALSPLFPIGLGGSLEPDPGVHLDLLVVPAGAALVGVAVVALALVAALRSTTPRILTHRGSPGNPVVRWIRTVVPVPTAIGAALALENGRGPRSLPVRPALTAAVAAILGIVGCLGLVRGIDGALGDPGRSGQWWDRLMEPADEATLTRATDVLRADPDVARVGLISFTPVDVRGAGIPVYTVKAVRGHPAYVVLDGRAPASVDEVAIGPSTAKGLGVSIGDRLRIGTGAKSVNAEVVGTTLLPQTPHASFDQGLWMTPKGLSGVAPETAGPEEFALGELAVVFRDGADAKAATARISEGLEGTEGALIGGADIPQDVLFLRNVRGLPRWLAAFFGVLGLAAVGHALVTAVRRRRQDLAVLRALGFRPRQAAACISWQAMTVGAVGLVVGIPLGIAAGRVAWRLVAESTPLLYVAPVAALAAALAIPATALATNALAVLPARRAARVEPAEALRIE